MALSGWHGRRPLSFTHVSAETRCHTAQRDEPEDCRKPKTMPVVTCRVGVAFGHGGAAAGVLESYGGAAGVPAGEVVRGRGGGGGEPGWGCDRGHGVFHRAW